MKRLFFSIIAVQLFLSAKEVTITLIVDDNSSLKNQTIDLRSKDDNIGDEELKTILLSQKKELNHTSLGDKKSKETISIFGIRPYKKNYILPLAYALENQKNEQQLEAQFQISLQKDIVPNFLGGDVVMAYTQNSYWQVYDQEDSRPFRESDYSPEIFYTQAINKTLFGVDINAYKIGYIHQSNGLGVENSRSWDRVKGEIGFDIDPLMFNLAAWYRIPEKDKPEPNSPEGDDNPGIESYIGYGELDITLPYNKHQFSASIRNNLQFMGNNRGSLTLDYSYPIGTAYFYLRYFSGFEESLIDYDRSIDRVGIGILLNR